jgi:hypothetical protein
VERDLVVTECPDGLTVLLDIGNEENLFDRTRELLADMLDCLTEVVGETDLILVADLLPAKEEDTVR